MHHLILLSGGIDSSTALALTKTVGAPLSALFVDYGQAAATSEGRSSAAIAAKYGVEYQCVEFTGPRFGPGEIRGRNAFLLHAALTVLSQPQAVVVIGIHAGTTYRDCTPSFVELMQRSFDFHTDGQVSIATPFLNESKGAVVGLAHQSGVPLEVTYSCEAGNESCGQCLSCRDREVLLAGS